MFSTAVTASRENCFVDIESSVLRELPSVQMLDTLSRMHLQTLHGDYLTRSNTRTD